jgi:hypothetical protein
MFDALLAFARWARWCLYQLSSARILGLDVDIVLHFGFGALIFAVAERRLGAGRAAWLLSALILVKEIADLFLKSQLRYITRPTAAVVIDIVTDVVTGMAGGLVVWLIHRRRRTRAAAAT